MALTINALFIYLSIFLRRLDDIVFIDCEITTNKINYKILNTL